MVAVITALFAGFTGCDKDNQIRRADLLGDWKVVKYNDEPINVPHTQTYKADGTFEELMIINDVPVPYTGTWKLDEDERQVVLVKQNQSQILDIVSLSGSKFVYTDYIGDKFELERP